MKQELSTVAIDLAKKVFHLVGSDATGKILWRKRLTRNALMPFIAQLPPVRIGIEACGGAHYWARRFREHGHEVKLMAPQFVKPFVKSNKNDMRDAEGHRRSGDAADHALCPHQGRRPARYPSAAPGTGATHRRAHGLGQ